MKLLDLVQDCYSSACQNGFYNDFDLSDQLVGIICEISEIIDADRSSRHCNDYSYQLINAVVEGNENNGFSLLYRQHIHQTFQSEFADLYMRTASLIAHSKIDYRSLWELFGTGSMNRCRSLVECAEDIHSTIVECSKSRYDDIRFSWFMIHLLKKIVLFADKHNVDLEWHIEKKLMFNESRGYLHGKKY